MLLDRGADPNAPRLPRRYGDPKKSAPSVGFAGSTPLHFAAANGHGKIVKILLANGAVHDKKDKYQHTPEDLAREGNHVEVMEVLRAWENLLEAEREKEREREEEEKKAEVGERVGREDGFELEEEGSAQGSLGKTARWKMNAWSSKGDGVGSLTTPTANTAAPPTTTATNGPSQDRSHLMKSLDHILHAGRRRSIKQNVVTASGDNLSPSQLQHLAPASPTTSFTSTTSDGVPSPSSPHPSGNSAIPDHVKSEGFKLRRPSLPSIFERNNNNHNNNHHTNNSNSRSGSFSSAVGRRTSNPSIGDDLHGMQPLRGRLRSRETDPGDSGSIASRRTTMSRHSLLNLFRRDNSRSSESPSPPRTLNKPLPSHDSGELEETIDRMREARLSLDGGSRPVSMVSGVGNGLGAGVGVGIGTGIGVSQVMERERRTSDIPGASDTEYHDALTDPDDAPEEIFPPPPKRKEAAISTGTTKRPELPEPSRSYTRANSTSSSTRPTIELPSPPASPGRARVRSMSSMSTRSESGMSNSSHHGLRPLSRLVIETTPPSPLGPGRDWSESSTVSRSYSNRSSRNPNSPRIPSQLGNRSEKQRAATLSNPPTTSYDMSPTASMSDIGVSARTPIIPVETIVNILDHSSDQEAHKSEKEDHIGESIWDRAAARKSKTSRSRGASFTSINSTLSSTPSSNSRNRTPSDLEEPPHSAGPSEEGQTSMDTDKRLGSYKAAKLALAGRPRNRSVSSTTSTSTSGNGFSSATYGTSYTPPSLVSSHLPTTSIKDVERDATPLSSAARVARRLSKRREEASQNDLLYTIPVMDDIDSKRYEATTTQSITTKEEARDLVKKTEMDILESISLGGSAAGSTMSLAAQLAAYGEGLALEDSLPSLNQLGLGLGDKRPSPKQHASADSTATITTSADSNRKSRDAVSDASSGRRAVSAATTGTYSCESGMSEESPTTIAADFSVRSRSSAAPEMQVPPAPPTSIPSINRIYENRAAAYRDKGQALLQSAPKYAASSRKGTKPPIAIENHWVMAGKPARPSSTEPVLGRGARDTLQVPAPPLGGVRDLSHSPSSQPFSALDLAPPAPPAKHRVVSSLARTDLSGEVKITPHTKQPSLVFVDQTPQLLTPKPRRLPSVSPGTGADSRRSSEGKIEPVVVAAGGSGKKEKIGPVTGRRSSIDSGKVISGSSAVGGKEVKPVEVVGVAKDEKGATATHTTTHSRSMSESVGGANVSSGSGGKSYKWGDISLRSFLGNKGKEK